MFASPGCVVLVNRGGEAVVQEVVVQPLVRQQGRCDLALGREGGLGGGDRG